MMMDDYFPDWYSSRKTVLVCFLFAIGIHVALFTCIRHFPVFGKASVMSPSRLRVHLCVRARARAVYDVRRAKPSSFFPEVSVPPKEAVPKRSKRVLLPKRTPLSRKRAIRPVKKGPASTPVLKKPEPEIQERDMALVEQEMRTAVPWAAVPPAVPPTGERGGPCTAHGAAAPSKRELAYPDYGRNPVLTYPPLARWRGFEGEVILRVLVSTQGHPLKVTLAQSSGHRILDETAIKAVRGWLFKPGKLNGVPIDMWVKIPVVFKLR